MDCGEFERLVSPVLEGEPPGPDFEEALAHSRRCGRCTGFLEEMRTLGRLGWETLSAERLRGEERDALLAQLRTPPRPERRVPAAVALGGLVLALLLGIAAWELGGGRAGGAAGRGPGVVTGQVLARESNAPLGGVRVRAVPSVPGRAVLAATTDAAGTYRIEGLEPGPHRLQVEPPEGRAAPAEAPEVTVPEEGAGPCWANLLLPRGRAVEGTVRDRAGNPLRGVRVAIPGRASPAAVSDAVGRWRLRGIPEEARVIELEGEGLLPERVEMPGGGGPVAVVLNVPSVLSGRVQDRSGAAVAGATVILEMEGEERGATSDAGGRFRLAPLRPGRTSRIRVAGAGLVPAEHPAVDLLPGEEESVTLTVERGWTLAGRILDEQGRPVAGAEVGAGYAVPGEEHVFNRMENRLAPVPLETDAEGWFRLDGLSRKPVFVVAGHPDHQWLRAPPFGPDVEGPVTLTLPRGLSISGWVVGPERRAVPGAEVVLLRPEGGGRVGRAAPEQAAPSPDSGAFQFSRLAAGTCEVHARAPSHGAAALRVEAGDRNVLLVLHPADRRLRIQVRDAATGAAVPRFEAWMLVEGASPIRSEGVAGELVLDGLRREVQIVAVVAPGYALPPTKEADLGARPEAALAFALERPVPLEVVALLPEGVPAPGARVFWRFRGDPRGPQLAGVAGPDGRLQLRSLGPGEYELVADHEGRLTGRAPVTLEGPNPARVEIRLAAR